MREYSVARRGARREAATGGSDAGCVEGMAGRGAALWAALTAGQSFDAVTRTLAVEACRLVDRLDRLDRSLRGGDFLDVRTVDERQVLVVDSAVAEARHGAVALKTLLVEIGRRVNTSSTAPRSALDELAARRAAGNGGATTQG